MLDEARLELALQCIPAAHLHACFTRLLRDLKANRAGMPDLIQFYPQEHRYRMIEVRAPATACRTTRNAGSVSRLSTVSPL